MLLRGAAVCWRLLVIGVTLYAFVVVLNRFTLMVVPVFAALFFTAMLHAPVGKLRRRGWPRMAATWTVLLAALLILAVVFYFVANGIVDQYPQLVGQVGQVRDQLQALMSRLPGGVGGQSIDQLTNQMVAWLQQHRAAVAGGVLTAGQVAGEIATGAILSFFVCYFFLADGDRMWAWLVRLLPSGLQQSVNGAGYRAFSVLSHWVVGTAAIACFHAVVIGTVLWLLGAPLVLPLAILVLFGSFIPIVGAVAFGGLAVLVTLVAVGWVQALILVIVLIVENQIEAHLLQPFIVGRAVRLHPVAIVLVLAGAAAVAGLIGAVISIPLIASLHAAIKYLTGVEDIDGKPLGDEDRMEPIPPRRAAPLHFVDGGRRPGALG